MPGWKKDAQAIRDLASAPRLNLDKYGMPKDYATYVWLLYKKVVEDDSPNRRAFLNNNDVDLGARFWYHPNFGQQECMR